VEISIPAEVVKQLKKYSKNQIILESREWGGTEEFEHTDLEPEDFKGLRKILDASELNTRELRVLNRRLKQLEGIGKGKPIKTLEAMEGELRNVVQGTPHKWVFIEDSITGELSPYLMKSIDYHKAERRQDYYTPAYVQVSATGIRRGDHVTVTNSLHREDIGGGVSAEDALAAIGMLLENDELVKGYEATLERYAEMKNSVGVQYVASGFGVKVHGDEDEERDYWYGRGQAVALSREQTPARIVIDDDWGWDKDKNAMSLPGIFMSKRERDEAEESGTWKAVRIPEHPYVRCFSFMHHIYIDTHVNNIEPYLFDRRIFDKVVLDEGIKELIDSLVQVGARGTTLLSARARA
jgi:hypothetical protein